MFVATLTLLALVASVAFYVYVERFSKILKHSGKLGGPRAYPLIGNGLLFAGKTPAEFLQTVGRLIQQYGKCFRIWLGTQMLIVITEPKDVEAILSSNKYIDKSIEYDFIRPWLGEETAMGTKVNAQLNTESEYVQAVKDITNLVQIRLFNFLIRYEIFYRFSANRRKQLEALKVLHGYTDSVIKSRREELNRAAGSGKNTVVDENENELGIKKKMAFLDMLLQSKIDGQPLTDLEIREEVDTFMFEGHDTTTSAISFLLQNLAKHPAIQQKVFDEVRNVVGDDRTRPVTIAMLNDMHYLDLVIKETLRLYPSVPMFGRKMMEDAEINGKVFPAGSNTIILPFFLGRNPEFFPNPEKFDPERFNVETSAEKTNPYQYVPFSAGPRNCIGQKFAVAEIKSLVSKLLRNYEILPPVGQYDETFIAELILRPEKGIYVRLQPRVY
uniref:Uncharacterized protein n=1 Tax=Anopheles arabiensis TaxID=7173 RepID=A0A1Y9GKX3_ANOAR